MVVAPCRLWSWMAVGAKHCVAARRGRRAVVRGLALALSCSREEERVEKRVCGGGARMGEPRGSRCLASL